MRTKEGRLITVLFVVFLAAILFYGAMVLIGFIEPTSPCICKELETELAEVRQESRRRDLNIDTILFELVNTDNDIEQDTHVVWSVMGQTGCYSCHGKATKGEE
jgi:hypothetical protein